MARRRSEPSFVWTSVSVNAKSTTPITSSTTYANSEDRIAFLTYSFIPNLLFDLPTDNKLSNPYRIILATTAPIKAEYLAIGPNDSTARDSICPGVSENKVWEATSGKNNPPTYNLRSKDAARATVPAASPPKNNFLVDRWPVL